MNSQRIEAAAARWVIRRQAEDWSEAEESQLDEWLAQSVAHRVAYIRLQSVWGGMERLRAVGAGVPRGTIPRPKQHDGAIRPSAVSTQRLSGRWDRWGRWGAAAALVLAVITGVTWYSSVARATDYATRVGQVKTFKLADGSQVILDTNSHISVSMDRHARHIRLLAGEAYFKVASDRSRPFVVGVGAARITDVGTEFSVRRQAGEMRVLVTEGRVALVSNDNGSLGDPIFVEAGNIAQTSKSKILTRRVSDTEQEQLLSWQSGFVYFRDAALSEAVNELNRYRTQKIVVADPAIASIRVGGRFRASNAEAFLALLQERFPVVVEANDTQILLRRRPSQ
jgi:transmembrane sensor